MILMTAAVGAAVCWLAFLARPHAPPAVEIEAPTPLTMRSGRFPERWIPSSHRLIWLRWLSLKVLGPPPEVKLEMKMIEQTNTMAGLIAEGALGPPLARSHGVAVWLLAGTDPPRTSISSTTVRSSITMEDRGEAAMNYVAGQTTVAEEIFPRRFGDGVEVWERFVCQSGGTTNFVARIRARLPYGHSAFVVDDRAPEAKTNRIGFLLYPDEADDNGHSLRR